MVKDFVERYEGTFGRFEEDDGIAISPDGDNESMVSYEICDDIVSAYAEKKNFIEEKKKKLTPMGKLKEFQCPQPFDEYCACILNFHLMGKKGGFIYFTARKDNILVFSRAYHTTSKEMIPDDGRDAFIQTIFDCME